MHVTLAYGSDGLPVDFQRPVDVIEPADRQPVEHPHAALQDALRHPIESRPLREIAAPGDRVAIVISDVTRPAPNRAMVRALLRELAHVPPDRIMLLIATGLHRPCTRNEIEGMLGARHHRDLCRSAGAGARRRLPRAGRRGDARRG